MQHSDNLDLAALQAAKQYMRGVAWPTVIFAGGVFAAYLMTVTGTVLGFVPLPLAIPVVAVLTYLSYTVLHEAAHGTISGNDASFRWLNDGLGYIAAWIMMIPLTAHRLEHMAHHRSTNSVEPAARHAAGTVGKLSILLCQPVGQGTPWTGSGALPRNLPDPRTQARAVYRGVLVGGTGPVFRRLVHGRNASAVPVRLYCAQTPRDTSTFVVSGPLGKVVNWLWVYQNYHSIHHLFPRVPFYRYQKLFAEIEPIMVARGAPIHHVGKSGQPVHA